MSKQMLEDMVRVKHTKEEIKKEPKPKEIYKIPTIKNEVEYAYTPKKSRTLLWVIAFFSILVCFFAISFLFAKADILVTPKTKDLVLNENLSASKDSNSNGLFFNLIAIPGEESETVQASGEKDVSIKATGTVIIYNSFSSTPQNLSIDTKLEGSNGKIYKTQKKVVVPGMSKNGTPGQVEVGIYAAVAGQSYNSGPLDFTILGFKGTPKYSKFKIRSKTGTLIVGGFVGQAPVISDADKALALSKLKNTMQTELIKKATYPDGFILYKNAVFLNTDDSNLSSVYNQDNSATLTLKGTLYGIIFSEQELTQKIAEDNVDKYDGSDIYIPNIKNLNFSLSTQMGLSDNVSFDNVQNINFNLSGPVEIVWKLDVDKFTSDLLGKSKKDFSQVLSQYSNIYSATLTITPVWKMSIPDKTKDVKVIVNYPQ